MRTVVRFSSSRNSLSSISPPCRRPLPTGAELFLQHLAGHLLDRAAGEMAELKRTVGQADQAGDRIAEMLEDAPHLAVPAFLQGQGDPGIRTLLALELGADRPIGDAI